MKPAEITLPCCELPHDTLRVEACRIKGARLVNLRSQCGNGDCESTSLDEANVRELFNWLAAWLHHATAEKDVAL